MSLVLRWRDRLPESLSQALESLLFLGGWRILIFLVTIVVSQFATSGPPTTISDLLTRSTDRWDAGWYLTIARDGYSVEPDTGPHRANIAFYPLLPILIKLFHLVIPSWRLAGMLVVHLALLGAVVYLVALVRLDYDRATALRATVALLLYPTAIFLTAIYTESLLLLALIATTYHARRGQWLIAGCWGLCATLTKTIGLIALIPLLVEYGQLLSWRLQRLTKCGPAQYELWRVLGGVALTCVGALAYPLFLWQRFGSLQVYFDTQVAWYRYGSFQPLLTDGGKFLAAFFQGDRTVINYFYPQGSVTLPSPGTFMVIDLLMLLAALILGIICTYKLRPSYGLLVLAGGFLTAYSGSPQSFNRYTLVLFPAMIALAVISRRPAIGFCLFVASGLLAFYHIYLFVNGHWAG